MNPIEVAISVEEEKKRCIDELKRYYSKYGEPSLQKLYDYLIQELETADEPIKDCVRQDLDILMGYMTHKSSSFTPDTLEEI